MWHVAIATAFMLDPELNREERRRAVWSQLRDRADAGHYERPMPYPPWWRSSQYRRRGNPVDAAEAVVFSTTIPVEGSPRTGQTLATVIGGSGSGA
jgi:hypothetical protein